MIQTTGLATTKMVLTKTRIPKRKWIQMWRHLLKLFRPKSKAPRNWSDQPQSRREIRL